MISKKRSQLDFVNMTSNIYNVLLIKQSFQECLQASTAELLNITVSINL